MMSSLIEKASAMRERLNLATLRDFRHLAITGGVGAVLLLPFSAADRNLWLLPLVLVVIAGGVVVFRRQAEWQRSLATAALESLCAQIPGTTYKLEQSDLGFIRPFEAAGLIGRSSRARLSYHVKGRHRDAEFESLHALLRRGSGKNSSTFFDGILAKIQRPVRAPFLIVITPRPGTVTSKVPQLFQNPQLRALTAIDVEGALAERFVVHAASSTAEDIARVRSLLTEALQLALLHIDVEETNGGSTTTFAQLGAAFVEDRLYLALPRQTVRRVGGLEVQTPRSHLAAPFYMNTGADLTAALTDIFDDVTLIRRLIERLR
jgi:hypothetical protein